MLPGAVNLLSLQLYLLPMLLQSLWAKLLTSGHGLSREPCLQASTLLASRLSCWDVMNRHGR